MTFTLRLHSDPYRLVLTLPDRGESFESDTVLGVSTKCAERLGVPVWDVLQSMKESLE